MRKENYFILETFDNEINMRVQFHYWIAGKYYFSSTELEDGTTASKKRISEKVYISALEEYYNA